MHPFPPPWPSVNLRALRGKPERQTNPTRRNEDSSWAQRCSTLPVKPTDMLTRPGEMPAAARASSVISLDVELAEHDISV